jgi:hypothetical protein
VEQSIVSTAQAAVHSKPWTTGEQEASAAAVEECVTLAADGARAVLQSFYAASAHAALARLSWPLSDSVQRQLQIFLVDVPDRLAKLTSGAEQARRALVVEAELGFEDVSGTSRNPLIPATPRTGLAASGAWGVQRTSRDGTATETVVEASPDAAVLMGGLPSELPSADLLPPRWRSDGTDELVGAAPAVMCLFVSRVLAVCFSSSNFFCILALVKPFGTGLVSASGHRTW